MTFPHMNETISNSSSGAPTGVWRVGVLEDDAQLREGIILPGLRYFGFDVTGAGKAAELYRCMLGQKFDLVVLDIGIPDENGLSVLRHLREMSGMGIVMLTANTGAEEHLEALRRGADAFLNKPVNIEILAATLHNVGRRFTELSGSASPPAAHGKWRMDTEDWCLVTPRGQALPLTAPERCVLRVLMDARGEPVARERLIGALSADIYEFDPHRLEMMVFRLRRKAQGAAGVPLPLLTVRGRGYFFAAEV
jgi:DNA-binding response OmpR family regulator